MRCAIMMLALIGLSSSAWGAGPQPNNFTPRSANIQLACNAGFRECWMHDIRLQEWLQREAR